MIYPYYRPARGSGACPARASISPMSDTNWTSMPSNDWKSASVGALCQRFPFIPAHPGLVENAYEERDADVSMVRIGQNETDASSRHEFMTPARVRTTETCATEDVNQVGAAYRTKGRHYAITAACRLMPSKGGGE